MGHRVTMGYPLIALTVFASECGLPFPTELILISAGSLIAVGQLNLGLVVLLSVSSSVLADSLWFEAGRHWGRTLIRILTSFSDDPRAASRRATDVFARWGGVSLTAAKFVPGLDTFTPPLAGIEGISRRSFLLYDSFGALLWSLTYIAAGFYFAGQVEAITRWLDRFGTALSLLVGFPLICLAGWRVWTTFRMMGKLRTRRMSPALLRRKMSAGGKIAIIDLLNFEESQEGAVGLPGAVRLEPKQLHKESRLIAPADMQIVLYGSSSGTLRSARVALSLQRKGFGPMWILEGGLHAWIAAGFPTANELSTVAQGAARLGIEILAH